MIIRKIGGSRREFDAMPWDVFCDELKIAHDLPEPVRYG